MRPILRLPIKDDISSGGGSASISGGSAAGISTDNVIGDGGTQI